MTIHPTCALPLFASLILIFATRDRDQPVEIVPPTLEAVTESLPELEGDSRVVSIVRSSESES